MATQTKAKAISCKYEQISRYYYCSLSITYVLLGLKRVVLFSGSPSSACSVICMTFEHVSVKLREGPERFWHVLGIYDVRVDMFLRFSSACYVRK